MERLTIKELAPYLPYGLKLYIWNGGYEKPIEYPTLIGLHGDSIIQSRYRFKSIHCGDDIFSRPEMSNSLSIIKPLLRPLSSLTEEIKSKLSQNGRYQLYLYIDSGIPNYKLDLFNSDLQILLAEFYDVFGLIDRGLALPIDGKEVEGE